MNTEQIQRWANDAAHRAGRALNQGKDLFYSSSNKAYDAARDAGREAGRRAEQIRREQMKRANAGIRQAKAYAPTLHQKWHHFVDEAGNNISRLASNTHCRLHKTESMLLKVGAVFLALKAFSHRNQPVAEIANEAKERINARPVESALIALGIGYALGKLLR